MSMQLRWVGDDELDRVAQTRLRCYGIADSQLQRFSDRTRADKRAVSGDYLLAELHGTPVGTATSLSLTMWCRGAALPCQGVAWVGAIKTMRRRGGDARGTDKSATPGVASTVMLELLRKARERQQVVTALMPFRASFYEHFGYGVVERRCEWTIPMSVLPQGPFDGIRFYEESDFAARAACLQQVAQHGQCDVQRSDHSWRALSEQAAADGFQLVDRPDDAGPVRGSMHLVHQQIAGKDVLRVNEAIYRDIPALRRQLHFLSSLRDQYTAVQITLPTDLPLNWLLREVQLPHRPVHHAVAEARPMTRMQVRILDHARFLQSLHLPPAAAGQVAVTVHEPEGTASHFLLTLEAGRAAVSQTHAGRGGIPAFACDARTWAAIACGNLPASAALQCGLAEGDPAAANPLAAFAHGPAPFCNEYF